MGTDSDSKPDGDLLMRVYGSDGDLLMRVYQGGSGYTRRKQSLLMRVYQGGSGYTRRKQSEVR